MIPVPTGSTGPAGSGLLVDVNRDVFVRILRKMEKPVVLTVHSGLPKQHKYLVRYEGYLFALKTKDEQDFSREAEVVRAEKIQMGLVGFSL